MKIGIVGSGIAGLCAAWCLNRAGHKVTLFEKQPAIGMDAHSLQLDGTNGPLHGDVPSRMFNELQWPNLFRLFREIGVKAEAVHPTQSLGRLGEKTFLNIDVAYRPELSPGLLVNPQVRKIISEVKRLKSVGSQDLDAGLSPEITLAEYLRQGNYSNELIYDFLYPTLSSTVCTCSYEALDTYPAKIILQTLRNLTGRQPLMRTRGGTSDVAARLVNGMDDIRLNCHVNSVRQRDNEVEVVFHDSITTTTATFEHFIVATQANQALKLLTSLSTDEMKMLNCFVYETIPVVVHRDSRLMPQDTRRWATFNMVIRDRQASMCSVWMNRFHKQWQSDANVFQTINPVIEPDSDAILLRVNLQRPIVNQNSRRGWSMIEELHRQTKRRIWFCGSYASDGLPLLESGVVSSLKVADAMPMTNSVSI